MTIYAERPAVAIRQAAGDLLVIAWIYLWIQIARWLHDFVEMLAAPGRQLEKLGTSLSGNLSDTGRTLGRIPLVGDGITAPLEKASTSAQAVAAAGRQQQEWIHHAALTVPIVVLILPLALVAVVWLPLRIRGSRRRTKLAALRDSPAGRDLLALRALTGQPVARLATLHPDIAGAWREADESVLDALAGLELRGAGLREPVPAR